MVVELIEAGKFSAYPDALRFLLAVKDAGIKVAAASSSKNAGLFLRQIRLDEFAAAGGPGVRLDRADGLTLLAAFDVDISGRHFEQGKPHPEIFLTAAQRARRRARARRSSSRTPSRASRPRRPASSPALGVARHDDEDAARRARTPTSSSRRSTTSTSAALAEGRLERRAG